MLYCQEFISSLSYATHYDRVCVSPAVLIALTKLHKRSREETVIHASTSVHQNTYVGYWKVLSSV